MPRPDILTGDFWDATVAEGPTWRLNRADVARFAAVALFGVGLIFAGASGGGEQGAQPAPAPSATTAVH